MSTVIDDAINSQTLIITATRRLALQLQENNARTARGVSLTPKIFSQADWVKNLWELAETLGYTREMVLISPMQVHLLWKNIIEKSTKGERLLRLQATSKQVASAWSLLKQWQLNLDSVGDLVSEETQLFSEWAKAFEQKLIENNFVTETELPDKLSGFMADKLLPIDKMYAPSRKILLMGFEDIIPQFKSFYKNLENLGWEVLEYKPSNKTAKNLKKHVYFDQAAEIKAACIWAKHLAEQNAEPGSIGIVVPDLAQSRELVELTLKEVLEPEAELSPIKTMSDKFNISVAFSLASYPVVKAALLALNLLDNTVTLNTANFLLRSPFVGKGESNFNIRSLVEYLVKQNAKMHITINRLIQLTEGVQHQFPEETDWLESLNRIQQFKQQLPMRAPLAEWVKIFKQFWQILDWPGERSLNSIEHQAVSRFDVLLEEFLGLERLVTNQDLESVKYLLNQLASDAPFQAQSKKVPIHVMGILEASSQPFKHLWVSGLHDEAWPPIPKPNAFLPHKLQRDHEMPHASSERELYFAKKLTETLKCACDEVVFSYYQSDGIKNYQPSDLISDVPESTLGGIQLDNTQSIAQQLLHTAQLMEQPDDSAPLLASDEQIRGGASLIQAQAACPFKAFVQYRLHTNPTVMAEVGLNAMERGVLVHKVLEKIWQQINDHKTLCELNHEEIAELLSSVIQFELNSIEKLYPELSKSFWEVEAWRLKRIITAWLQLEKERPPFKVVAQEKAVELKLANLKFKMRFDRVDMDHENRPVIIDYKTSVSSILDCFGERPDLPQLPLYCISNPDGEPNGVVFAQLRAEGCQFVGVTESPDMLPGVKSLQELKREDIPQTWQGLLTNWREVLENLAGEFKQGVASVTPSKPKSCQFCHLAQVCRINSVVAK